MTTSHVESRRRWSEVLLVASAVGLSLVVYYPITRNYFHADDFLHLYSIANGDVLRFILSPAAGHVLFVRNALYVLFHAAFGTEPAAYFWVVLLTHGFNTFLLFKVARAFDVGPELSFFAALLWGVCPVHEGSLGWYAVYGHVVATTALLLLFWQLSGVLDAPRPPRLATVAGWCLTLLVAISCFGVGIGAAMIIPFVAWLLFPSGVLPRRWLLLVALSPIAVLGFYMAVLLGHAHLFGGSGAEGLLKLVEVTLVASTYVGSMAAHLLGAGAAGLLLGQCYGRELYPGLSTVGAASAGAATVLLALGLGSPRSRRVVLAFVVTAVACYATVAAGRAVLLGSLGHVPATAATTYRYHYAGQAFLALAFASALACLRERVAIGGPLLGRTLLAGGVGLLTLCYLRSHHSFDHHDRSREAVASAIRRIRTAIMRHEPGSAVYIANRHFRGFLWGVAQAPELFPGTAAVFAIFFPDNTVEGRRVFFVAQNEQIMGAAARGGRIASLLVPPSRAPQRRSPLNR